MRRKTDGALRIEHKSFVEFDTSESPPVPKSYTRVIDPREVLKVTPFATMFSDQQIMDLRQRAEEDERLQKALGERYAFLSASLADIGEKSETTPKLDVRLQYFNYVSNRAVHVWFSGGEVGEVQVQPEGYQPPESDEEIATAEEVVRRNPSFKEAIEGIPVYGILTPAPKGHRYIYLMFRRWQKPAIFYAIVDLTASEIIEAGHIKHHSEGEQR